MAEIRPPVVHVEEIKPIARGNLRAFAKIRIGPLTMHDFRVIQQGEQRAYVSPPQAEYEVSGQRRYKPLLEMPPEWKQAIQDAVLVEWEALRG